jgi:hypothetical protein
LERKRNKDKKKRREMMKERKNELNKESTITGFRILLPFL